MKQSKSARTYIVRGRVQGVGFRYFAEKVAKMIGVQGYVRNQDDGSVEVYAVGTADQLAQLAAYLWKGPRFAEVRGVDEKEAAIQTCAGFQVER